MDGCRVENGHIDNLKILLALFKLKITQIEFDVNSADALLLLKMGFVVADGIGLD